MRYQVSFRFDDPVSTTGPVNRMQIACTSIDLEIEAVSFPVALQAAIDHMADLRIDASKAERISITHIDRDLLPPIIKTRQSDR